MLCRLAKQCEFLLGCLALLTSVAWAQPQLSYQRVSYGINTFAGLRIFGDGGPAVQTQLYGPVGVAVDGSGNLYIADRNNSIRKVDSVGTITTVAGRGDDNVDPAYGFDGDGGPALRGRLYHPTGVAVDGLGNLYIADHGNHSIRRVDSMGTITKIAGGRFEFPGFGGDGVPATAAQLAFSTAVAVDGSGNLYIADSGNHRIRILMPRYRLDFAHFANGASVTSDLVLVNVAPHPIRPAFYFYDKDGSLIAAESVIEVTGDLEVAEDGALTVRTEVEPLGELTISTHGRGKVVRGSVAVVANGPIGGVLRFDLPGVGVAGVGAGQPVRDAIFPARRQASRISTAAAIRILDDDSSCTKAPIPDSSSPPCRRNAWEPARSTKTSTVREATWKTASRNSSWICSPTGPAPERCAPINSGCICPPPPTCSCTHCVVSD